MLMLTFVLLAVAFLLFLAGFCLLLARGMKTDSLNYDMDFLWENYSGETRAKIRESFK
jgi:hypothetical protein